MGELANSVIREWEQGEQDRLTAMTVWQEIVDYLLPNRADYIVQRSPGQKRMEKVYTNAPIFALYTHANGLQSLLTSPWMQFAYLWTHEDRLNSDPDVFAWLQDASEVMYRLFSTTGSNFAPACHELYLDEGSIGTACMSVLENRNRIRFSTRHMKEVVVFENEDDEIDKLVRRWKWTPKQAVDGFGEETLKRAGADRLLKAFADGKTEKVTFLHRVGPRRKRDRQRIDRLHKPFESVYVLLDEKAELEIGGFDDFPFTVPRFSKVSGETYGRGLGDMNRADIKVLNEMVKTIMKSAQKVIDPPLQVPDDGFLVPIKTVPGAINYYRSTSQGRIEPVKTDGQVTLGVDIMNGLKADILKGFYVDWMVMPSDPQDPASSGKGVTATYVLQQRDEKMRLMAPVLSRLQTEFLGPLIDRVFALLFRRSLALRFGPGSPFRLPPPALRGVPLRVEYVSPLALAQKSSQMDAVTRLLQMQEQLRQMDPNGQLIIDSEFTMRLAGRDWNAPSGVLRSPDELQEERDEQAKAAAAQQNHEGIANLAGAGRDAAGAVKGLAEAGQIAQQRAA